MTNSATKPCYEPFPSSQIHVTLINDDGVHTESLKLDDKDPIFAESFRSMITDHFAEGKHFFVAKILSKKVNWAVASSTVTSVGANSNSQVAPSVERPSTVPLTESSQKFGQT